MSTLVLIAMLLQSYVGAVIDEAQAERIVNAMSTTDPHFKQDILIIIAIESAFNEKATSSAGARGLMQLTRIAVKDVVQRKLCGLTVLPTNEQLYQLFTNVQYGSCFYEYTMLLYKDRDKALAYYNGGWKAVRALEKGKPFPETAAYLKRFKELEQRINEATSSN